LLKIFLSPNVQIRFPIPDGKEAVSHNSRLKCTNSSFETVHMGKHFEYIIIIYTTRYSRTRYTHTSMHLRNTISIYILLLFHYDILTRTSKQLYEDRFGIAFCIYIIERRRHFNHFNDLRENIIPLISGAWLPLHNLT